MDIQVTVNNGGVNQLENAGTARVTGAEMAVSYRVFAPLTVGGSAAYTDARLTSPARVLDLPDPGARLPLSPRYNFAVLGTYNFNIVDGYTGAFTLTDRYLGSRNIGFGGQHTVFGTPISPLYGLRAYSTTDLDLAVNAPHGLELGLFLKNLFDKVGEVSANTAANQYNSAAPVPVYLSQPRTVGVSLKVKFN
jgi:outer membrane receptor protein involved in Fe transport